MSVLNKILGNASEVDEATVRSEVEHIFVQGEIFENAYRVYRDLMIFTNLRLIIVDKQGLSGNKLGILTVPYKNIVSFAINTAGSLDLDSELSIQVKGYTLPLTKAFKKGDLIFKVQEILVRKTCA
jgi:acid stress-induced BolA-like protein IbaG/YrbA